MVRILSCVALIGLAGGVANAALFNETESNNTLATANSIGSYGVPGEGILVDGTITAAVEGQAPGDVDWFAFTILPPNSGTLVASIFAINSMNADTTMWLVDSTGTLIQFDDDDGPGFQSALDPVVLATGTYYIGIAGFPSAGVPSLANALAGGTNSAEAFSYKLIIGLNVIPTPGAAALIGAAGLMAGRRRR